jgi:Fe-S-cluster-containing dehydrogenase component
MARRSADHDAYGADPSGAFLNRVHSYEVEIDGHAPAQIVHFPKSCLHCEDAPCVTVCPTGASYKRAEDGIVLVNPEDLHRLQAVRLGLPLRRARIRPDDGVMKKCTLCVDRIYNENLARGRPDAGLRAHLPLRRAAFRRFRRPDSDVSRLVAERGGDRPDAGAGDKPVNKYLPPGAISGIRNGPGGR